jgi:hypothetical protein
MCSGITIILIIMVVLLLILLTVNYYKNRKSSNEIVEKFSFAPYEGNQSYPYVYQKTEDSKMLQETLKKWEKPFNENNEGYLNAEPYGAPPLTPIYSFDELKDVKLPGNYL